MGCGWNYPEIYAVKKTTQVKKKTAPSKKKTNTGSQKKAAPTTSAEARKRQEATQREIKLTEEEIKANESKVKNELAELGKLETEITETRAKVNELSSKVSSLNHQITGLEESISKNESELEKLRGEYLKAVKKMRVTGKNKSGLAFIFSSGSFNQALRRMRYLKEFSDWKSHQTAAINSKIADLRSEKDALAAAKEEQKNALNLQKANENKLGNQYKKQEILIAQLKENGAALKSHLKQKQAEANELGGMVSKLIAQEQEAQRQKEKEAAERLAREERLKKEKEAQQAQNHQSNPSPQKDTKNNDIADSKKPEKGKVSGDYASARKRTPRSVDNKLPASNESGDSFASMKGKLPKPVSGHFIVTSRFGRQTLPDLPDVEFDNPGIDAEVDKGAHAQAVYGGDVSGVYLLPGYNTVVIVNHGGYYTVYGNISNAAVKVGDSVRTGQNLGLLALNEDNPDHGGIHFEVWKNREKMNPLDWLR